MKKIILALFVLFMILVPLNTFGESFFDNLSMGLLMGYEVVDGVTYQTLSLRPVLKFGKFSVGLDLFFEFDQDFNLRKDSNGNIVGWTTFNDYINKILFIQWGEKGEPLYIKYGLFEHVTLGHGLIMQNYTNGLYFPEWRKSGLEVDLDGTFFNFPYVGFESFVDDIKDPDIIGVRLYVRPLIWLDIPIVNMLKIGFSYVTDLDPLANAMYQDNSSSVPVTIFGIDFEVPVFTNDLFTVITYADWAQIIGKGSGAKIGFMSNIIKIFLVGGEIYFYGDKFTGPYFDMLYDNLDVRNTKYSSLDSIKATSGWKVYATLNIGSELFVTYAGLSGSFDPDSEAPSLIAMISLKEGVIPIVSGSFTFIRKDIRAFSDLWNWSGTALLNCYMILKVNFQMGSATTLYFIYERKYELDQNNQVQEVVTSYLNIGAQISF